MYIYIDKTGTIRTQIDHGEPVRQGNPLRLVICFGEDDENVGLNSYITVETKIEDIHSKWGDLFTFTLKPELEVFKKIKTSEITYDLIDGKRYKMFEYGANNGAIPCEEYTTLHFGKLECLITLYDADGNKVLEDLAEINVSPTYGKIVPEPGISTTEYEELKREIALRAKADGGTLNNVTLTGSINLKTINGVSLIGNENLDLTTPEDVDNQIAKYISENFDNGDTKEY